VANILIVDDEHSLCDSLSNIFSAMGHTPFSANTLKDGLKLANSQNMDVVFLDVRLPDGNGIKALPEFKSVPSHPEVIVVTGYADPDSAELAMKSHAWDYIKKPASMAAIKLVLGRAIQYREEKSAKNTETIVAINRGGIIGTSGKIMDCLNMVARAAKGNKDVLIVGETGTGKELFSRAIHDNSDRRNNHFIVVDCASLPETLIESILFGHSKGAFTGANKSEQGLIRDADGGTLFLDEIGELPMSTQKTFLRVLQERRFRPVGETREVASDFRLVSATNKNLDEMVGKHLFRSDLLYRIRSVSIDLPPLRERKEDIKDLAVHYLMKSCEDHGTDMKGFSADFLEALESYPWPGNVRELYNTLDWVVTQALYEPTLYSQHLPTSIRIRIARSSFKGETGSRQDKIAGDNAGHDEAGGVNLTSPTAGLDLTIDNPAEFPKLQDYRNAMVSKTEKNYLERLFSIPDMDIKKAAAVSGLSPPRIYQLLKKYDIPTRQEG